MPVENSVGEKDWWQFSLTIPENIQARKEAHRQSKDYDVNPKLCFTCKNIDFEYLFFGSAQTGFRTHSHEGVYLGTLRNICNRALAGCTFCAGILIPKARGLLQQPADSLESISGDDCVSVVLEVSDIVFSRDAADLHRSNGIYVCIKTHDDKPEDTTEPISASILPVEDSGEMSHPPVCLLDHGLSAYRCLRPQVDLKRCQRWFKACCRDHSECKQTESSKLTSSSTAYHQYFKLIDVKTREVVKIGDPRPNSIRYATLSYVCGEAYTLCVLHNSGNWKRDAKGIERHPLPTTLPKTIADSLKVTAELGLDYLWVDSICIAQDERAEKQAQILAMYHIYALSEVCIVAASGKNSQHGLPGVTESRKLPGNAAGVTLRGALTVGYPQPSLDVILKEYQWIRRAWTYQEILLARRCLIFTETEAFFFCSVSTLRESIRKNPKGGAREYWADGNGYLIGNVSAMVSRGDSRDRCNMYAEAVEKYTQRELTFQQDGINAFRGMERFFGGLLDCETVAGCPESMLVNCLTWTPEPIHSAEDQWPSRRMSLDSKDTEKENDLHLIPLLPSWAWAAWKCASRIQKMPYYFWESEMKILKRSAFHRIPHPDHPPYEFALEECNGNQYLKDFLPVLTKVSQHHFQIAAHPDYLGFVKILTKGEEVGECDVRGMLDTRQLTSAQDVVILQIWVGHQDGKGSKCAVMLVRLHSLLYNPQRELAQRLLNNALAETAKDATAQCMNDNTRFRDKMKGKCPADLIVPRTLPWSHFPLLATRIGIGMVDFDAWRDSKPGDFCVILA